jgi:hypothetical protein
MHAVDAFSSTVPPMNPSLRQQAGNRRPFSAAAALTFGIIAGLSLLPKANAQTASGLISSWGKTCKNAGCRTI